MRQIQQRVNWNAILRGTTKKSANLASACRERSYILIFRGYFIDSAVVKLRKF
ncbi:hypothetical protein EC3006_4275 [Escherichia coli 3006]|nr:hypothetical protein EC3006_4275 [Escherichia coli 3006]